jgi:ABC-type sugar transport system ATPase subunit
VIRVEGLSVRAGGFSLHHVSFAVAQGDYAVLMGKTGSGKTTLLEAVAGLKPITAGRVMLHDRDVTRSRPSERNLGYVPQDGALFTRMSVRDHLAFALVIRRWPSQEIAKRVVELARILEIEHLLGRIPRGLSGGERQRVALGRALSFRPQVLCLDEPLTALDDVTRQQMYALLSQIRRDSGVTTLHVTHSLEEAGHLADVIYRIENGSVVSPAVRGPSQLDVSHLPDPHQTL